MLFNRSQHNVAGQLCFKNRQAKKQTNKFVEKEIRLWLAEVGGSGGGNGCRQSKSTKFQLQDKYILAM